MMYNGDFSHGLVGWLKNPDTTLALDNADYANTAPSAVVTHSTSGIGWSGIWTRVPWVANTVWRWTAKIKGEAGLGIYMQANFKDASLNWIGDNIQQITLNGGWMIVTGTINVPSATAGPLGDLGFFFKDDTPANYAASLGKSFRIDSVVIEMDETATTQLQPTLPAETPFSDAEIAFLDESPPGLYPENQNSNFGYFIRKIFSDHVQTLINQLDVIYNEKFVDTAIQYLTEWELTTGLPTNPTGYSTAQRRMAITNRLRKGAFTNATRHAVIQSFIVATFGDAVSFDPSGIPITAAGIPLYSGASSLAGTYAVRENWPLRNKLTNSNFEVNVSNWSAVAATLVRDTAQAKFGTASMRIDLTPTFYALPSDTITPAVGDTIAASAYVYGAGAAVGKPFAILLRQTGQSDVTNTVVLQSGWQRIAVMLTAVNTNPVQMFFVDGGFGISTSVWVDGVQFETIKPTYTFPNGTFETGVSDWHLIQPPGSTASIRQVNTGGTNVLEYNSPAGITWTYLGSPILPKFNPGRMYVLKFRARQTVGTGNWELGLNTEGNQHNVFVGGSQFTPTSSWQTFQFSFVAAEAGDQTRLWLDPIVFNTARTLQLDDVELWSVGDYGDPSAPGYSYDVRILNSITVDLVGLTRELKRITPAGISFNVISTPSP